MDGFEILVAEILHGEGFWIRQNVKVPLTKEEKERIQRPSCPRWEIDVLAYRAPSNEILAVECKSYLDSPGVDLADLKGGRYAGRYKLFNEPLLRQVVFDRLRMDFVERGLCAEPPTVKLALAVGRIRSDRSALKQHFEVNDWKLFDPDWIRERIEKAAAGGYVNSVASMVAKLILRKEKAPARRIAG
jgi:hypothetical protein